MRHGCTDELRGFFQGKPSVGVALRAGLLRAPLSLDPGTPGLLRTLRIPNAVRNIAMQLATRHSVVQPPAILSAGGHFPAASCPHSFAFFSEMWHFLGVLLCNAPSTAARCLSSG